MSEFTILSPLPYPLITLLMLGLAQCLSNRVAFCQTLVASSQKNRHLCLDGLRGFLATGVFFHHATISYYFFQHGAWMKPPSVLYSLLGTATVKFFFMITGLLFWEKAIRGQGSVKILDLYRNRFWRLCPLYWFSVLIVVVTSLAATGFHAHDPVWKICAQIGQWLLFGPIGLPDINGFPSFIVNAGVNWTLWYEWVFYLSLPFFALLARPLRFLLFLPFIAFFCLLLTDSISQNFWLLFLAGMTVAHIHHAGLLTSLGLSKPAWTIIPIGLLASLPIIESDLTAFLAMFIIFVFFIEGNTLFGMLTTGAARLLGTLSYSIYLVHGLILFYVLNISNQFLPIKNLDPVSYWSLMGLCSLALIVICLTTYRLFEHPFLNVRRLASTQEQSSPIKSSRVADSH